MWLENVIYHGSRHSTERPVIIHTVFQRTIDDHLRRSLITMFKAKEELHVWRKLAAGRPSWDSLVFTTSFFFLSAPLLSESESRQLAGTTVARVHIPTTTTTWTYTLRPSLRIDTFPGDATGSELTRGIARRGDNVRAFTRWQLSFFFFSSFYLSPSLSLSLSLSLSFWNRKTLEEKERTVERKQQATLYEQRTTMFY